MIRRTMVVQEKSRKTIGYLFVPNLNSLAKMRPPSPSIPEKEFLVDSLKQSLRLDGRALLEQRPPIIKFGPELGWVECSLGKTRYAVSPSTHLIIC